MNMEISETVKSSILSIQNELRDNIESHHQLVLKIKEDPTIESEIKPSLLEIQRNIINLNEKQKVFIEELKKEINNQILNGYKGPTGYNFNLYDIKPGQLECKKRRRKDLVVASSTISQQSEFESPCSSGASSPAPSFDSSFTEDEDSMEDVETHASTVRQSKMTLLPALVRNRPKLLPETVTKKKTNCQNGESSLNLRSRRSDKIDSRGVIDLSVIEPSPVPSPEPTDTETLKLRLMAAVNLLPIHMLSEFRNRKVERKRRSTANNPHFVYNNDWEVPVFKRSKTYLSPTSCKSKARAEDRSRSATPKEEDKIKAEKPDQPLNTKTKTNGLDLSSLPADLIVEKIENGNVKAQSSTTSKACVVCQSPNGLLSICKVCSSGYHIRCNSNVLHCPSCKMSEGEDVVSMSSGRSSVSGKEEFAAKCPNIAQSYNKLKDYIQKHKEVDEVSLIAEKKLLKAELVAENQKLYSEKAVLEERATQLSEKILIQEEYQARQLKEENRIMAKIKIIADFVNIYQKTNVMKIEKENEEDSIQEESENVTLEEVEEAKKEEEESCKHESDISSGEDGVEFLSDDESSVISEALGMDNLSGEDLSEFSDKDEDETINLQSSISDNNNSSYSPEFLEDDMDEQNSQTYNNELVNRKIADQVQQTMNGLMDEIK